MPRSHPEPHLSPGAGRSWTCSRCAARHLGWETADIWGDQLASEGAPTPTDNQPQQTGKHSRTHSQWAVLLAFRHTSGRCDGHVARKILLLIRDSEVSGRRVSKPMGSHKGTLGHRGGILGFRESVPTTGSLGTARHTIFVSAAAQRCTALEGRKPSWSEAPWHRFHPLGSRHCHPI